MIALFYCIAFETFYRKMNLLKSRITNAMSFYTISTSFSPSGSIFLNRKKMFPVVITSFWQ